MKDRNQMTRICSACGLQKPLAAFLELSSTHGTRYGTICATCRGSKGNENKAPKKDDEQSTVATTGTRIGLKERVFIEKEQKKQDIVAKEERIDQLAERDMLKEEKDKKVAAKEKAEKNHRSTYLDLKQPGFLGKKFPSGTLLQTPPPSAKIEQGKGAIDARQQELEAAHQEVKNKNFNLRDQYVDPQAGETRAHSATFLAFQDSLEVTPFKIIRERLAASRKQKTDHKASVDSKDPLLEFVEKTWGGPSSTRKR
jgi:hypothetical protein